MDFPVVWIGAGRGVGCEKGRPRFVGLKERSVKASPRAERRVGNGDSYALVHARPPVMTGFVNNDLSFGHYRDIASVKGVGWITVLHGVIERQFILPTEEGVIVRVMLIPVIRAIGFCMNARTKHNLPRGEGAGGRSRRGSTDFAVCQPAQKPGPARPAGTKKMGGLRTLLTGGDGRQSAPT